MVPSPGTQISIQACLVELEMSPHPSYPLSLNFTEFIPKCTLKSMVTKYWFAHSVILRAVLAFETLFPPSLRMRPLEEAGKEIGLLDRNWQSQNEGHGDPQKPMWTIVEGLTKENTLQGAYGHISTKNRNRRAVGGGCEGIYTLLLIFFISSDLS